MSFKIHVEPSGKEFTVENNDSVLDAALHHGVAFPYGCRNGACGSCKGKIVSGTVDYGDYDPNTLTDAEKRAGMALFCQARPLSDLTVEVKEVQLGDIQIRKVPVRVAKIEKLAPDVVRLFLKGPNTVRLQFLAGQYLDFLLPTNKRRSFSIANAPHDDEFIELHIRHVPHGNFTDYIFDVLKEKDLLRVEMPFGGFYLRQDSDRPMIFMAGGTGFAPIKGIIEHAFAEGVDRPMHFYWGVRSKQDLYLDSLPRQWTREHANFHYVPVLSDPKPEDNWQGRTGFVHNAVTADFPQLSGFDVYTSGPPIMVNAGKAAFLERGLPADRLFYDSFEFAADTRKASAS